MAYIQDLPPELLFMIFNEVDWIDYHAFTRVKRLLHRPLRVWFNLKNCQLTCKAWHTELGSRYEIELAQHRWHIRPFGYGVHPDFYAIAKKEAGFRNSHLAAEWARAVLELRAIYLAGGRPCKSRFSEKLERKATAD